MVKHPHTKTPPNPGSNPETTPVHVKGTAAIDIRPRCEGVRGAGGRRAAAEDGGARGGVKQQADRVEDRGRGALGRAHGADEQRAPRGARVREIERDI